MKQKVITLMPHRSTPLCYVRSARRQDFLMLPGITYPPYIQQLMKIEPQLCTLYEAVSNCHKKYWLLQVVGCSQQLAATGCRLQSAIYSYNEH